WPPSIQRTDATAKATKALGTSPEGHDGSVAVVQRRSAVAQQRAVFEGRTATLLELGLGGGDGVRALEQFGGGQGQGLGRQVRALQTDGRAGGHHVLPGVAC